MMSERAREMNRYLARLDGLVCGKKEWKMMRVGGVRIGRLPELCARIRHPRNIEMEESLFGLINHMKNVLSHSDKFTPRYSRKPYTIVIIKLNSLHQVWC